MYSIRLQLDPLSARLTKLVKVPNGASSPASVAQRAAPCFEVPQSAYLQRQETCFSIEKVSFCSAYSVPRAMIEFSATDGPREIERFIEEGCYYDNRHRDA